MKDKILIDDLDISIRCYQLLKQSNIVYLNQLTKFKKDDMLKFKNFGKKSLQEIDEVMKQNNLEWLT
jgi:DNA-directed RNA polymerase subunit alpha